MNIENNQLDIRFVRSQFPAFKDKLCKNWVFLENAGGSYVPNSVVDRLKNFMISTKVQPYAEYPMSKIAGDEMDTATEYFAKMINAKKKEIIIGGSTSINLYVLSNALKKSLKSGDEIIVTNQDHEANISPWRRLEQDGIKIIEWKINKHSAELEVDTLLNLLNEKTKLIAVTHCSNIVGSVNDIKRITKLAHANNTLVMADGVSYAPHGFPDVKDLDVDFYSFSLYKTYGPHLALLYGKEEIIKELPNQNHSFLKGEYPYTLNPGGPNHEELSSLIGIYEYMNQIYEHHFSDKNIKIQDKIAKINDLISKHEEKITNPILEFISENKKLRLIGKNKIINKNRAPTISFTHKIKTSKELSELLVANKIATRNDNFYAWRCLDYLGIDTNDGVVRLSLVHYNNKNDVNKVLKALDKIN